MSILLLSCGTRSKLVQYFKKELRAPSLVVTADCSHYAPALYEGDIHHVIPRVDEAGYLDTVFEICREHEIKGVVSLVDPELTIIAKHRMDFLKIGALPIISDEVVVELCQDKHLMYNFLNNDGIKTPRSYVDKEQFFAAVRESQISYPVVIKPIRGSASVNLSIATSDEEVVLQFDKHENMMIQQHVDGTEFGIDSYIDMDSGELVALFAKKKLRMREGETEKSVSVKSSKIMDLITKLTTKLNLRGVIDVDMILHCGDYYILEVNPRFGGGYPHAYECGVNIPKMIVNNMNKQQNMRTMDGYDESVVMMKYYEVRMLKDGRSNG
ncbi:ATP-grasp domain-containing protein [bacterium]|nr:ATP-grasp domain-containing protein [bacterium]